jgi:hypothetical protein
MRRVAHLFYDGGGLKSMYKALVVAFGFVSLGGLAIAQSQAAQPAAPQSNQLTPQVLGEMLRSATTFHELVRNLNLNKNFGPDVHVAGPDGVPQHSVQRTAETIGAGAGVGAAIGGMTKNQNGVLIGALIGGAGGLIVDQILKHKEEAQQDKVVSPLAPEAKPLDHDPAPTRQFRERVN